MSDLPQIFCYIISASEKPFGNFQKKWIPNHTHPKKPSVRGSLRGHTECGRSPPLS